MLDFSNAPQWLLIALTTVLIITVIVLASTSGGAFGIYNPAWDGTANLQTLARAEGVDVSVVRDVSQYDTITPESTTAIILAPNETYSSKDVARLRRFVERGGLLVIADDFGQGTNILLQRLGANSRIEPVPLRDEREFYRSPAFPLATGDPNASFTDGVDSIVLNHPAAVSPNGARVLVTTSPVAYADENNNEMLDESEEIGQFPVVTSEDIGSGTLIVASDPSLFINVMLDQTGNRAFVANLYKRGDFVVLDYSHSGAFPPLTLALLILRDSPLLQAISGIMALVSVIAWQRRIVVEFLEEHSAEMTRHPISSPGEEELLRLLHSRYPNWDGKRLKRVVAGLMSSREKGRRDE